jgi:hypothetical protein
MDLPFQRLEHRLRVALDDAEERAGGAIGRPHAFLPIAQRAERQMKPGGEPARRLGRAPCR